MDIFEDEDDDEVVGFIVNILFANENDSESEEEDMDNEDLNPPQDNVGYENFGLQRYRIANGDFFADQFRMTRGTFERLVMVVGDHMAITRRLEIVAIPVEVSLLLVLWIMTNPDSFRSTANQFFQAKSTVHSQYTVIIQCLNELAGRFIKWPDRRERDVIKYAFERRYGYPGVVGCIDGTNITITAPLEQKRRYVNRHHSYSVIAQAVCDHKMLFRDIYVGQPGSVGDARTFARSPLSRNLLSGEPFISEDEHLLGDGAYALMNQVLKPYVDNGNLDPRRKRHNRILSAVRSIIDRSFGRLKIKFRRLLKRFQTYSIQYCNETIVAAFVLHNFILLDGEDCPGITRAAPGPVAPGAWDEARLGGAVKREVIADQLFQREGEPQPDEGLDQDPDDPEEEDAPEEDLDQDPDDPEEEDAPEEDPQAEQVDPDDL